METKTRRIGKPSNDNQRFSLQLGTNIRDCRCLASLAKRLVESGLLEKYDGFDMLRIATRAEQTANDKYAEGKRLLMAHKLNNMDKH